jgi:hypothetical protein
MKVYPPSLANKSPGISMASIVGPFCKKEVMSLPKPTGGRGGFLIHGHKDMGREVLIT